MFGVPPDADVLPGDCICFSGSAEECTDWIPWPVVDFFGSELTVNYLYSSASGKLETSALLNEETGICPL